MKLKAIILLLMLALLLSGCASAMSRAFRQESPDIPRYYPGIYLDGLFISTPFRHDDNDSLPVRVGVACGALIDLPLSAIFDTIFLPVDIWAYEPQKEEPEVFRSSPQQLTLEQRRQLRDAYLREQEKSNNERVCTSP